MNSGNLFFLIGFFFRRGDYDAAGKVDYQNNQNNSQHDLLHQYDLSFLIL
jgi:hypothetical protein